MTHKTQNSVVGLSVFRQNLIQGIKFSKTWSLSISQLCSLPCRLCSQVFIVPEFKFNGKREPVPLFNFNKNLRPQSLWTTLSHVHISEPVTESKRTECRAALNHMSSPRIKIELTSSKAFRPGFPGGPVVGSPPANAGDTGSSPGPGRSHMPWSN